VLPAHKSVNDLDLVFHIVQVHSKVNVLLLTELYVEVLLHKPRYEGHSTLVVFDFYHIVLVDLKFANGPSVGNRIGVRVEHVVAEQHVATVV
jgi:hypothetical protein